MSAPAGDGQRVVGQRALVGRRAGGRGRPFQSPSIRGSSGPVLRGSTTPLRAWNWMTGRLQPSRSIILAGQSGSRPSHDHESATDDALGDEHRSEVAEAAGRSDRDSCPVQADPTVSACRDRGPRTSTSRLPTPGAIPADQRQTKKRSRSLGPSSPSRHAAGTSYAVTPLAVSAYSSILSKFM
jgi:hypothetical protein